MTINRLSSCALMVLAMLMPLTAHADLYAADAAHEKKDYERAFVLYRELAELGRPEAQESLAAMYVNGEGVKRDNVQGYAWATLALENGAVEAAKEIVRQLEPHLNAAARAQIAEVHAKFGKAALQERLLPAPDIAGVRVNARACEMRMFADPRKFYSLDAKRLGMPGIMLVEATVAPDGHARNARVLYARPADLFDEAGRRVAFANSYTPPRENGVAVACTIRFNVKFKPFVRQGTPAFMSEGTPASDREERRIFAEIRSQAEAGDPLSQLKYQLLIEMRPDLNVPPTPFTDWALKAAQAGVPLAQYLIGEQLIFSSSEQSREKGVLWLQMAADAGQMDAQAALANYLLRKNSIEGIGKALDLLEKAAASGNKDGKIQLAAALAAGPEPSRRDPKRALELLTEVKVDPDFDPTYFEIRAAAYAMLGEFAQAQEEQKHALQKARRLGWDLADPQARLASYAASKSWVGNFFVY